jgi:hypothetical protein
MNLNAYLFAASVTQIQIRPTRLSRGQIANLEQIWGATPSVIVCADTPDHAQKIFEDWLHTPPEGQNPLESRIHNVVAAQLVDELLLETGSAPLVWPQIARQSQADVESTPADNPLGHGYWLNVNEVFGSSPDLEALRRDLPAEISSELNWSADQQYYFVVSALSPSQPPPPGPPEEPEAGSPEARPEAEADEFLTGLAAPAADIPQLPDLEAAALMRARNSAVAVWRWRQYAAATRLADHQIRLEPWCGVLGVDLSGDQP